MAEYSWDNATWTAVNTQGATVADCGFVALAGAPSLTLYIRVKAGTVQIAGTNWKSAASGAVVHKLAASGQNLHSLAIISANASWRAAVSRLGINARAIIEQGFLRTANEAA